MNTQLLHIQKPRCFLVYALAPTELSAVEANRIFNEFIADGNLPLAIYHDHFIGQPGGVAVFYVDSPESRDALLDQRHLAGWDVQFQPLIFSYSPAAFDEQTAFTLKQYRGQDWESLQREKRPTYGDPAREAQTAKETVDD